MLRRDKADKRIMLTKVEDNHNFRWGKKYFGQIIPSQKPLGEAQKEMEAKYPHLFAISAHIFTKFISFKDKTLLGGRL